MRNGSCKGGRVLVMAAAVLVALGVAVGAAVLLPERTVSGQVIDGDTGRPLGGAVVVVGEREIEVGEQGAFSVPGVRPGTALTVRAPGYQPASTSVDFGGQLRITLSPRVLEGTVLDTAQRGPMPGVEVSAGPLSVQSDAQGRFRLVGIEPGTEVAAKAEGYGRSSVGYEGQATMELALNPNALEITAVNQYTGEPLAGAEVSDGRSTALSDDQGKVQLRYLRTGDDVQVRLEGFAPVKLAYAGQLASEIRLRPDTVTGVVRDARGQPVVGATVSDGVTTTKTDEKGAYRLSGVAENSRLTFSATGFDRQQMDLGQRTTLDAEMKPFAVKGLYLTFYGVGDDGLRNHVLELARTTEINAVVIDVKGDRGWLAYRSSVPLVKEIDAQQEIMIQDPKRFLADLRQQGVYSIARIVTFKDNPLAVAKPHLSVINGDTGRPWVDNEGLRWSDPTLEEVWDYNIALAVEAIELGFDEVQFDYVRFPTDAGAGNRLDAIRFSTANNMANRTAAINGFLAKAYKAVKAKGGNLSADIFGYVVWRDDDMGIGQYLEDLAKHLDYVSPMVYPNLFWDGIAVEGGVKYADQQAGLYPYEIVYESMKIAAKRIGAEKLRPWLQYYNDYLTGKDYGAAEVIAQKRATYDNGITGWMFWDPSNRFAKGGFEPE